jgi:hypothetical protein
MAQEAFPTKPEYACALSDLPVKIKDGGKIIDEYIVRFVSVFWHFLPVASQDVWRFHYASFPAGFVHDILNASPCVCCLDHNG